MTQKEAEDYADDHNEGSIDSSYGPFQLGTFEVWEVWVKHKGAFDTRFILSEANNNPVYFSNCGQLCAFANGRESQQKALIAELKRQLEDHRGERLFKLVSLVAATSVFVGCVGALIYFMVNGTQANLSYLALLGGIIASGATMFFGNWKMPKIT